MKYPLLLASLSLGLIILSPAAARAERDWDKDFFFESDRDFRASIGHLREHYDHVAIEAERAGEPARVRLHEIRRQIAELTEAMPPARFHERVHGIHEELHRLGVEIRRH